MELNKVFLIGLFAFIQITKVNVEAVQTFEQQPTYTEVNPGDDTLLACKIFSKRGSCSWQKDNKPVGMYKQKYEWAGIQANGDCSISIKSVKLEFDDGFWECQVTASDFHSQDALTSQPIKVIVRVAPQRPRVEFNSTEVLPGHNLTSLHGDVGVIKCISHYGNPPPVLKWFIDQNEIIPTRKQTNSTELDNPRTWLAISLLELTTSKENHGRILKCVAVHESYSTKSSSTDVRLDVMFPPETRLMGIPSTDIEELIDSVAIRCVVNANPVAAILWKKEGQNQPTSLQELLQFNPAVRQHAGLYTCHARNKAGESQPIRVQVNVKYAPKILSVGPDRLTTAPLFTSTTFECIAEGNPHPTYQWLQRLPMPLNVVLERGRESKLNINNITYDFQGEYVCKVTNIIGGMERTIQSEAIALQVVGAPQVLRHQSNSVIEIEKGLNAKMSLIVCADPRPKLVAWEWGSLRLEAGSEMGRYSVDEVLQNDREDCYLVTLHIKNTETMDSRSYFLVVENDRGIDRHAIKLYVKEKIQMSSLIALSAIAIVSAIILICVCIYANKSEKCCFTRKGDFKPSSDTDTEKFGIEIAPINHHQRHQQGAIHADALYTNTSRGGSRGGRTPEAMQQPTHIGNSFNIDESQTENSCFERDRDNLYLKQKATQENGFKKTSLTSLSFNKYPKYLGNSLYNSSNAFNNKSEQFVYDVNFIKHKSRPKPLQADNDVYYNHIFPDSYHDSYRPNSSNRAEL